MNKQRITIVLKELETDERKIKFIKFLFPDIFNKNRQLNLFDDRYDPEKFLERILKSWNEKAKDLREYWYDHPNLRLTQVLVNLDIIPNESGLWYYTNERDFLLEYEILEERDIIFWGQNFDKDMKPLPKTNYLLIKDMESSHIENILRDYSENKLRVDEYYVKIFIRELNLRKDEKL